MLICPFLGWMAKCPSGFPSTMEYVIWLFIDPSKSSADTCLEEKKALLGPLGQKGHTMEKWDHLKGIALSLSQMRRGKERWCNKSHPIVFSRQDSFLSFLISWIFYFPDFTTPVRVIGWTGNSISPWALLFYAEEPLPSLDHSDIVLFQAFLSSWDVLKTPEPTLNFHLKVSYKSKRSPCLRSLRNSANHPFLKSCFYLRCWISQAHWGCCVQRKVHKRSQYCIVFTVQIQIQIGKR